MEGIFLLIILLIVVGFFLISQANIVENKTKESAERAKAERERAAADRAISEMVQVETQEAISRNRALALVDARTTAEKKIIEAERQSLAEIEQKVHELGELKAVFAEHQNHNGSFSPSIEWSWSPFGNAVLKIHRNSGGIVEGINAIKQSAQLVFAETTASEGTFIDKEASGGNTYTYYVFIEVLRQGFRSKAVTRPIPTQFGDGEIINPDGSIVTQFDTVEPEPFEELIHFGLKSKRVTVSLDEDPLVETRRNLARRQSALEIKNMEKAIAQKEQELAESERGLSDDVIEELLLEAKIEKSKRQKVEKHIARIQDDPDLDDDQKEELIEEILARIEKR